MKKSLTGILLLIITFSTGYSKEQNTHTFINKACITTAPEHLYSEAYVMDAYASQLYVQKGKYRMAENNYTLAVLDFQHAVRLNAASFEAYCFLGQALAAQSLYYEALEAYDTAIELNPFFASAYFERASLLQLFGRYQEANNDYTIAFYIDPVYSFVSPEKKDSLFAFPKPLQNELNVLSE